MKTILIIEDSEQNLYLTRFILEQHGYAVLAAPDGPAGIASALLNRPALILLDIQLPGMDGYQVAHGLRSHAVLNSTPIVAVTSYAMAGDRERVLAAGCTGYLEKPINPDTFISDVESFLIPQPPAHTPTTAATPPIHALVIDDLEPNREILRTILHAQGWTVTTADNGSEALALARTHPPDVVISDILMPGMDGFTLCREWHRDPRLQTIPFAFYTATYTDPQDEQFGLSLGADLFLTKPLEPDALLHRLNAILSRTHPRQPSPPHPTAPSQPDEPATPSLPRDEQNLLRQYNAALVRKLEDKMLQVEAQSRDLEQRVADRTRELEHANLALQAFGHMGTWTSEVDPNGRLTWSPETCRIFGVTPSEFDGRVDTFFRLVHPDDLETVRIASREVRSGRRRLNLQHRIRRPDGQICWVHQEGELTRHPDGRPYKVVGIARDITDYRHLEDQFRQSQKMEAIGQLAGGVAHDFNNLLTVIRGHSALIATQPGLPDDAAESLREITAAAERASNLTRQLLTFSRRQSPQLRARDLNEIVTQMARMLRTLVGERITFHESLAPGLPRILADTTMMEQVVMNLVVNARDAMPLGGELSLSTSSIDIDTTTAVRLGCPSAGLHVRLAVTDTGCGIDACHLPHIFEPFFTTKEQQKGTGLGLAVVYGIVHQHGGHITVSTQAGSGTTFTIYLPATFEPNTPDSPPTPTTPTTTRSPAHARSILVVDDDPSVRQLLRSVLTRHGYQIHEADDARKALALWKQLGGAIDLVITDLAMPGPMSGRDLVDRLHQDNPRLRAIFSSGYSPEATDAGPLQGRKVSFLQKPYHLSTLLNHVATTLES